MYVVFEVFSNDLRLYYFLSSAYEKGDCSIQAVSDLCPLTCGACKSGLRSCSYRDIDNDAHLIEYLKGLWDPLKPPVQSCNETVEAGYCVSREIRNLCPEACQACDKCKINVSYFFCDISNSYFFVSSAKTECIFGSCVV